MYVRDKQVREAASSKHLKFASMGSSQYVCM
jgi:tRNA U34 2-thiouridine synthase MnmA/TrmU